MTKTTHSADPDAPTNVSKDSSNKSAKEVAAETASKARDYAFETSKSAGKATEAAVADVRDNLMKASDAARDFAVRQPVATAAGALVVGVLLGMAINNRR